MSLDSSRPFYINSCSSSISTLTFQFIRFTYLQCSWVYRAVRQRVQSGILQPSFPAFLIPLSISINPSSDQLTSHLIINKSIQTRKKKQEHNVFRNRRHPNLAHPQLHYQPAASRLAREASPDPPGVTGLERSAHFVEYQCCSVCLLFL